MSRAENRNAAQLRFARFTSLSLLASSGAPSSSSSLNVDLGWFKGRKTLDSAILLLKSAGCAAMETGFYELEEAVCLGESLGSYGRLSCALRSQPDERTP
jgi:hypothetical protein